MDYAWLMHGLCMDYAWIMRGLCMDYVWIMRGLCMDFVWMMPGLCCMDYAPDYAWVKHGLCMEEEYAVVEQMTRRGTCTGAWKTSISLIVLHLCVV
jgi:hypothetical protein